jgi:hypothetical protein
MASLLDNQLREISQSVMQQNGEQLASLLHLDRLNKLQQQSVTSQCVQVGPFNARVSRVIQDPLKDIVSQHMRAFTSMANKNYLEAFQTQAECADSFFAAIMKDRDTNWWLPAVNVVLLQLRKYSYRAEETRDAADKSTSYIVQAQEILTRFFSNMIIDRSNVRCSKKMGCLFVIVHLLKIYFKIKSLRLCNNLINTVNNKNSMPPLSSFPMAQQVAYNYYLGRLQVFEEEYEKAGQTLMVAFTHCHREQKKNKRRILQFLIPVRLLLGFFPAPALLHKYQLTQFSGIVDSIRGGNLKHFNETLEEFQDFFINKGIFLILEKLRNFVYRNLFRKVYLYNLQTCPEEKSNNQLKLSLLQASLRVNGIEMETDELECILANLIWRGSIKGYIAHLRCVVLSKTDPFPPPSASVTLN